MKIKPKQEEALEEIAFNGRDCRIALLTGYGKSLIYQLLPSVCDHLNAENFTESKSIVLVVYPLNAIRGSVT